MTRAAVAIACSAFGALALSSLPAAAEDPPRFYQPDKLEKPEKPGFFKHRRGFSADVYAAPSFRTFYGLSGIGADFGFDLGAQTRAGGFYGGFGSFVGRTPEGLLLIDPRLQLMWQAPLTSRWRLGLMLQAGIFGFRRVTNGDFELDPSLGPKFQIGYDLVQSPHAALFAALRTGFDAVGFAGGRDQFTTVPELSLLLGGRFGH